MQILSAPRLSSSKQRRTQRGQRTVDDWPMMDELRCQVNSVADDWPMSDRQLTDDGWARCQVNSVTKVLNKQCRATESKSAVKSKTPSPARREILLGFVLY